MNIETEVLETPKASAKAHTALSLFSGCGGCSLGLMQAGFELALGAEIDGDAYETYRLNVSDRALRTDLTHSSTRSLLETAKVVPSDISLLVAGPPCQGFSSAGGRDWDNSRNSLLKRTVDLISEVRPPWIMIENVEGLLTAKEGFYFVECIVRLLELGYWLKARKVYMQTYGIPQKRKRVIIIGNLVECEYDFPEPTFSQEAGGNLFDFPAPRTILDAIDDLGNPGEDKFFVYQRPPRTDLQRFLRNDVGGATWHGVKAVNDVTQARISALKSGQTMRDLPEELQHPSYQRRAWRRVMDGTPTEKRGGAPSGLKKLMADEPSLTITSASPTEFIHPLEPRLLTLRECARIQTFPDAFNFIGGWSSVATQIGNAIPPMFMKMLATNIVTLNSWNSISKKGRWLGISASKSIGYSPALESMLFHLERRTAIYVR